MFPDWSHAAGISFTFLTTAQNSIKYMMEDGDSFDTVRCLWVVPCHC